MDLFKTCGTCSAWITDKPKTFTEKLKVKYQTIDPHCRHDGKNRTKDDGAGCWWGHKMADQDELQRRGNEHE